MNKSMNLPQIQQTIMEFEKESDILDMKGEMMSDTIDEAIGEEDDEEEQNAIVDQVLDEIGIDILVPVSEGHYGLKHQACEELGGI